MTDQEQLLDTVAELSHILLAEEAVQTTLQRVVELAREAIEHCDGVGITLVGNGRPTTAASTDAFVLEVDRAQYRSGAGRACVRGTGMPVLVPRRPTTTGGRPSRGGCARGRGQLAVASLDRRVTRRSEPSTPTPG